MVRLLCFFACIGCLPGVVLHSRSVCAVIENGQDKIASFFRRNPSGDAPLRPSNSTATTEWPFPRPRGGKGAKNTAAD